MLSKKLAATPYIKTSPRPVFSGATTHEESAQEGAFPFEYEPLAYQRALPLMNFFAWWVGLKKKLPLFPKVKGGTLDTNLWCYDGASQTLRKIREGAARWPALEVIYNWETPVEKGFFGAIERFWLNMQNAQAVRNRYKIVRGLIRKHAIKQINEKGFVRILSLASGSAQSVFDATQGLENVHLVLVDADETALSHSKELALKYGATSVEYHNQNVLGKAALHPDFQPDIVEVVGLFDYLSPEAIATTLKRIHAILPDGGAVITGHIHPNDEANFLRIVSDWDFRMKYRTIEEFKQIVCSGNFEHASYYTEPHRIHTVAEGVKR